MVTNRSALLAVAPLAVWFGFFLLIYGVNALACAQGWPPVPTVAAETILTAVALALEAWPMWVLARDRDAGFYRHAGLGVGALSSLATLWIGATVWVVETCR